MYLCTDNMAFRQQNECRVTGFDEYITILANQITKTRFGDWQQAKTV